MCNLLLQRVALLHLPPPRVALHTCVTLFHVLHVCDALLCLRAGSTYKRQAHSRDLTRDLPTLKDLDIVSLHSEGILLDSDAYNALKNTVVRDCLVLHSYSPPPLLVSSTLQHSPALTSLLASTLLVSLHI